MSRRLIAYVHVDGVAYGPNDDVPPRVAKRIGDHAWTDGADEVLVNDPGGSGGDVEAPPRSGRGSGIEAWRAFAEAHGLDVDEDRTREQIIADLEERGVIEREE
ncbi:hypothetical protein [Streptomyces sp. NBC_01373]|uniref:hypothetical protein n=1 Tax=Streptomyces sp. NBC_01373 TaxID=2903843 RepID=UPI002251ACA4|nr:hypothetical protein [Streptomyces sp. NBC_01373]MCX4705653.1 hypothetical protein [Streptomyces sp. NBC_01373]